MQCTADLVTMGSGLVTAVSSFNKVMVIMSETWLTTQEAADFSGYHVNYIRQIIRAKKIKARKFGPVWQVSKESLQTYLQTAEKSDDKRLGPK